MIADNDTKQKAAIQFLGVMLDENMGGAYSRWEEHIHAVEI